MNVLDSPENLYTRFFASLISEEVLQRRPFPLLYPDAFDFHTKLRTLIRDESALCAERDKKSEFAAQAWSDLNRVFGICSTGEIRDVDAIDTAFQRQLLEKVVRRSEPGDQESEYCSLVCEFGALIGDLIVHSDDRCEWFFCWPIWDSCVRREDLDRFFPVFHWCIKRFSDDEDPLMPRVAFAIQD